MSSGYYSPVPNYGGRQPDNVQNIKHFVPSLSNAAIWIYKKATDTNTSYITINDPTKDVVIPKDLIVTGSINSPSDITLKENVELITDKEIDSVLEVCPRKYNFISDSGKKTHYGIIAQELESLLPELVTSIEINDNDNDNDNVTHSIKTVNYIELIPLLICKMQKMQQEIDKLKGEVNHF